MLSGWRLPEILNRLIKYLFVYVSELLHVSDAAVVLPEKDTAAIALYRREPLSHNGMCEHIKFDKYSLYCLGCVWPYNTFFETGRLLLPWQPKKSAVRAEQAFHFYVLTELTGVWEKCEWCCLWKTRHVVAVDGGQVWQGVDSKVNDSSIPRHESIPLNRHVWA